MEYIWLCIVTQEYDCSHCKLKVGRRHQNLQKAIRELYLVLSTWILNWSLVLDISVHSLSDPNHHFKNVQFGPNAVTEPVDNQETIKPHDQTMAGSMGRYCVMHRGKSSINYSRTSGGH
jgi:hypothetical protein